MELIKQISKASSMTDQRKNPPPPTRSPKKAHKDTEQQKEVGGRKGPEPTRYGDWENNGIASDF